MKLNRDIFHDFFYSAKTEQKGRATVGMHVGPYSVREIGPEFVQIGCHCIPVENLRELDKALNA